jgi:hypothetical protein
MVRWLGTLLLLSLLANAVMVLERARTPEPPSLSSPAGARATLRGSQERLAQCEARLEQLTASTEAPPTARVSARAPAERDAATPPESASEVQKPAANRSSPPDGRPTAPSAPPNEAKLLGTGEDLRFPALRLPETPEQRANPVARFDENRLRSLGLGGQEIDRLRDYAERMRTDAELALEDASRKDVNARSGASFEKDIAQRLWEQFRRDFGDEAYDVLRYGSHQTNRAQVEEVVAGSPAQAAGFQPGDAVLSYDGQRVFSQDELAALVRRTLGRGTIVVEVERGGRRTNLYVPHGQMGIVISGGSLPPSL